MNKTLLPSFIFQLIFSLSAFSQTTENDTLTFAIEYEKPERLSMLSINIPLYHLGLAKTNFSIYDLKGSIHYVGEGKINAGVSYKFGLGDKLFPDTYEREEYVNSSYIMSIHKPGKAQEFSAYATFFIKANTESKEERFDLKKSGRIQYYTVINTKRHKKHGISVGYTQGFTWYNMNNVSLDLYNEQYNVSRTEKLNSMSTIQQYKFITVGYQHTKSVNSKVHFSGYGAKTSRYITVTGANLIYAVQNQFDDVYLGIHDPNAVLGNGSGSGTVFFDRYKIAESNKRLNVGVEFYQRFFIKRFPISLEYRAAYLPGLLKNINIMLNVGANIQIDALRGNLKKFEKPIDKDKEAFQKIQLKIKGNQSF